METIWELRFTDGRGASLYTDVDLTADLGRAETTRTFAVASSVSQASPLTDARRCFASGEVLEATAQMAAIAYAVRYDPVDE